MLLCCREKKLLYLLVAFTSWKFGDTIAQGLSSCDKGDEAGILLDTAQDFISRAKGSIPSHSFGTYYEYNMYTVREDKSSVYLETATNLMLAAKEACTVGDGLPKYKVVCYYSSWSHYRKGSGKFEISNIDANLCTHIIYAFAKFQDNQIEAIDGYSDLGGYGNLDGYRKFNDLKLKNPKLKTLIAIGGWNAGSEPFSRMASDPGNRTRFVKSVAPFLQKYGFDGLDMSWKYPGSNGGSPEDKENFVTLLQELKTSLKAQGLLLTAAVPKRKLVIDLGYDIPAISKELDFINLMTYDFHGYGYHKNETGMNSPLFRDEESDNAESTVDFAVDYWLKGGAAKDKLVMGMSLRAKSYTLANPAEHDLQAVTAGPGQEGPYTRQAGSLGFNEICLNLTKNTWNSVYDSKARASYAYKGNQWVSYDDQNSFNSKIDYAKEKGLAI